MTDEELTSDWLKLIDQRVSTDVFAMLVKLVAGVREDEPRINSGVHLIDYLACEGKMDDFYGSDYFSSPPK